MIVLPSEGCTRTARAQNCSSIVCLFPYRLLEGVSRRTARREKTEERKATIMLQRPRDRTGPPGAESPKQRRRMKEYTVPADTLPMYSRIAGSHEQ